MKVLREYILLGSLPLCHLYYMKKSLEADMTMLERIRSNHEEIETLERLVMKALMSAPTSPVDRLSLGHHLRNLTSSIITKTDKLVETYETNGGEIEPPVSDQTDVLSAYFQRLEKIREHHTLHPSERLLYRGDYEQALQPPIPLCQEEDLDLDLHPMYFQYINSTFGERVEYSAYLDVFSQPQKIQPALKLSRHYEKYLRDLLEYLISFFRQTEPLHDLDRLLSKVETDFEAQYVDFKVEGLSIPLIPSVSMEKNNSLMEAKVIKLCNLLDETIKRTKQKVAKASGEMEEEGAHAESESCPLNQTMGWDNKPIPYWLHKLGLGQEYKCEICGNSSHAGKRAFERHFKEWRHQSGLRRLGITSTEEFNVITSIEEAKRLFENRMPHEGNELGERMPKRQRVEADGPVQETNEKSSNQVLPPQDIKSVVKRTALILSIKGQEFQRRIIETYGNHALFKILKSSDRYHTFFLHKLAKYRAKNQEDPAHATTRTQSLAAYTYSEYSGSETFTPPKFMVPQVHKYTCRLPYGGITRKELDVFKITAEFFGRYGECLWDGVWEKVSTYPEFKFLKPAGGNLTKLKFMKPADERLILFERLALTYYELLRTSKVSKDELRKNAADVETVLENCYHRIQWYGLWMDHCKKVKDKRGRKVARFDEAFVHLVEMRDMALRPAKPDANRPKIDESELVPEDEFLAQQPPGSATIWINIPKVMDAYVEVRVQSLLETVASLKAKIDQAVDLPVSKQEISGKTGVLKDNKSLAYYNVGAGEMLTMSVLRRTRG